jgi:hypothetical protein
MPKRIKIKSTIGIRKRIKSKIRIKIRKGYRGRLATCSGAGSRHSGPVLAAAAKQSRSERQFHERAKPRSEEFWS